MRFVAILCALSAAIFLQRITARADEAPEEPTPRVRFHLDVGWPEGITYDVGTFNPELDEVEPLGWFEDVYLTGRVGARLDLDAAAFVTDDSLPDFDGGVEVRRLRFYLTGDFRLGVPLAYNFEFSVEGSRVFLNGFSLRYKPDRWLDAVDVGYLTPPMGLDNVVSSRARTLMEVAAPVQALAPGYRSGLALAGHWTPWLLAWKLGFYSVGQAQLNDDASDTNAQVVGRPAGLVAVARLR